MIRLGTIVARSPLLSQSSVINAVQGIQRALNSGVDAQTGTSKPRLNSGMRSLTALALGGVAVGVAIQQTFMQSTSEVPSGTDTQQQQPMPSKGNQHEGQQQDQEQQGAAPPIRVTPVQNSKSSTVSKSNSSTPLAPNAAESTEPECPWVIDERMELIMHRRAVMKNRLVAYLNTQQKQMNEYAVTATRMGKYGEQWFNERMMEMEPIVDLQAQMILFGVEEPNARRSFLEKYGCTKWSEQALEAIKSFGPIIEIGAGHGHWQHALKQKNVDVIAFDDNSALPMDGLPNVGEVKKGNEKDIKKNRKRTLLLVYPGTNEMASNCLKEYKGNVLLYVGESRGGVNGTDEFFDMLQKNWRVEKTVAVEPFPEGYEQLYVMRRK